MRRHESSEPVLITEAAPSYDEEFATRKRRYTLIMAIRIPCLILAGVFGVGFNWPMVAVAFIVLSVPVPWVAVLIANDRLPNKARKVSRYKREPTGLAPVPESRILEAAEVLEARSRGGDGSRRAPRDESEPTPPRTGTEG